MSNHNHIYYSILLVIRETFIPKIEFIRTLDHPYFVKVKDYKEAEEYLADKHKGEIIIRPSSKGYDHLAITWKVWDELFQHIGEYSYSFYFYTKMEID